MKIHCEAGYDCRSFMTGDWMDENGIHVMHERTYNWPRLPKMPVGQSVPPGYVFRLALMPEASTHYWMTDYTYTDKGLAYREAKQFGFKPQQGFYCEEPDLHWFPIFYDWDKALAFLKAKTGITYESETEDDNGNLETATA